MSFLKLLRSDRCGGLRVNVLGIVLIIATFIVWLATFTPVFMVIDMLTGLIVVPELVSTVRLCNIASGLVLVCEVVAYLIWMVASAFKQEDQTYYGGSFEV